MASGLSYFNSIPVGTIMADNITATYYSNVPIVVTSNFAHTSGNDWQNIPFNSLSDTSSGGEQHFIAIPFYGKFRKVMIKNTGSGTATTADNLQIRVLVNGVTQHTSSTVNFVSPTSRQYNVFDLSDEDIDLQEGDDLRVQFKCTSGLWQDTCASVVFNGHSY